MMRLILVQLVRRHMQSRSGASCRRGLAHTPLGATLREALRLRSRCAVANVQRITGLIDVIWRYKLLITSLGGGFLAWRAYCTYRPEVVANKLVQAFEKGFMPVINEKVDAKAGVPRPELHAQLKELLRPGETSAYALVVGAHGTGKSTAVRKAVREIPADGTSGVVYFSVEIPSQFSTNLCKQLGVAPVEVDIMEAIRRIGMQETKSAAPDHSTEPFASWAPLSYALQLAAVEFREKHTRPMTLVIDNAQKVLRTHPAFLDELQDFAKVAADSGNLRVVFVSSDFTVATHMQRNSEWSRCKPLEIGESDITEEQAVDYLTTRLAWPADDSHKSVAQYIVSHITGTRFSLLNSVEAATNTIESAKAWGEALHRATKDALATVGVSSGHPLFRHLLDAPGKRLGSDVLREQVGITDIQRDTLVKVNVLAAHTDRTYTCASRHVVETFKVLRDNPAAASAPAGCP